MADNLESQGFSEESAAARRSAEVMDTTPHKHQMLPVWFFVGITLVMYGILIFISGIYELSHPPDTVLANLHAPIWWGIILVIMGAIFVQKHRPRKS